jgi:hypothetical protein
MGEEFIRKAAPSYRKGLDRYRLELGTRNLFTRVPDSAPRTFAAKLREGQTVTPGEKLGICLEGEQVIALRGLDPVATLMNPPGDLKADLSKSHGEACGQVQEVHEFAGIAEIAIIW